MKSAGKLDKGQGLEPEEMSADRNSLCTTFPDKSTNIRSVVPSVASWEPELLLTVTVCRRQQSWSSGWTTGPAISFLCPSPVLRGQASQGHSPSLPPQVTSSCLDLQSIPGSILKLKKLKRQYGKIMKFDIASHIIALNKC